MAISISEDGWQEDGEEEGGGEESSVHVGQERSGEREVVGDHLYWRESRDTLCRVTIETLPCHPGLPL